MVLQLAALHVYPVKSGAALAPRAAEVQPRGLEHDRRWMVVDAQNRFITGREEPRLVLLRAEPEPRGLRLRLPDRPDHLAPLPDAARPRIEVAVWNSRVAALPVAGETDDWLSDFLGRRCRLVFMDAGARRGVDPRYAQPWDELSFADAFPLLLITQASLDGLNARLARPVPMLRFRPNLVIAGSLPPHAEDLWRRLRIGAIEFDVVKPCVRCGFTTVRPETGTLDPTGEPLRTLATYRRAEKGVTFGQNLIARGRGRLQVGDAVQVLQ